MRIERVADLATLLRGSHLFDQPPIEEVSRQFLASATHHLPFAFVETEAPVGFISGVETLHPDKGVEMYIYELGVDEPFRRKGVATELIQALSAVAQQRDCHSMWVPVDADNEPARAASRRAGATEEEVAIAFGWTFSGPQASD